jgi:hypothetical protein
VVPSAPSDNTGVVSDSNSSNVINSNDDDMDGGDADVDRGVAQREYLKEILVSHSIWQDGNFWEQVLWQCAIEQVKLF